MNLDEMTFINRVEKLVLPALKEYFGECPWVESPKTGQSAREIKLVWGKALKDYSDSQILVACAALKKYKLSMTFPVIGHLLRELSVTTPERRANEDLAVQTYTTPSEVLRKRTSTFFTTRKLQLIADWVIYHKLPSLIGEQAFREIELSDQTKGGGLKALFAKADELSLFDKVEGIAAEMG